MTAVTNNYMERCLILTGNNGNANYSKIEIHFQLTRLLKKKKISLTVSNVNAS